MRPKRCVEYQKSLEREKGREARGCEFLSSEAEFLAFIWREGLCPLFWDLEYISALSLQIPFHLYQLGQTQIELRTFRHWALFNL